MRPGRPSRTATTLVAVCLALWGVARTTGSGWILVVISVASGLLTAGLVMPAVALRRQRVEVSGPRDATVGSTARLALHNAGPPIRIRAVDPPGPWMTADAGSAGHLEMVPVRRGLVEQVSLLVECAAPLGVFWWRRRFTLRLDRPVEVGPAALPCPVPEDSAAAEGIGEEAAARGGDGDAVRSAREYRPGDPVRLIHWAATARRGEPMVKELEHDPMPTLIVVPDLSGSVDDQERAAGRALGMIGAALAVGRSVVLGTREPAGPLFDVVHGEIDASRRLARAMAVGPPEAPADLAGGRVEIVRAW